MPLSNFTWALLLVEWQLTVKVEYLTAKSTNLKEKLEMSSQFLSPEQPYEPKSLDVALNIR